MEIEVKTEFGLTITYHEFLNPVERTCLEYPYSVDLCLQACRWTGSYDEVLAYCNIEGEQQRERIKAAVDHYHNAGTEILSAAKELADVYHVLQDSFPDDDLHLIGAHRDDERSYFMFALSPPGTDPQVEVPCPKWLKGDFRQLWQLSHPCQIGLGLDRVEHSAVVAMEGYDFSIREYFARDINRAIEDHVLNIQGAACTDHKMLIRRIRKAPRPGGRTRRL